jgi:hypothetical protein
LREVIAIGVAQTSPSVTDYTVQTSLRKRSRDAGTEKRKCRARLRDAFLAGFKKFGTNIGNTRLDLRGLPAVSEGSLESWLAM